MARPYLLVKFKKALLFAAINRLPATFSSPLWILNEFINISTICQISRMFHHGLIACLNPVVVDENFSP